MNNNVRIVGESMIGGGNYGNVQIIGMASANAPMACQRLSVIGEFHTEAGVTARQVNVAGAAVIGGNCKIDRANVKGEVKAAGNWKGTDIDLKGEIIVGGNCEVETATIRGSFTVDGLCNFDRLEIISHNPNRIHELGGRELVVRHPYVTSIFHRKMVLVTNCIEVDDIEIDYVKAKVVRGRRVRIGSHCCIGTVEYTDSLAVAEGAKVGARQKTGQAE